MLGYMRAVRAQFFLSFAVMGSLLPYLTAYLKTGLGLSEQQIGWLISVNGLAIILSPVVVTYLADRHIDARRLMAGVFGFAGLALFCAGLVNTFVMMLLCFAAYSLAFRPVTSLQDAIAFGYLQRRREGGLVAEPYHRIRVFGTYGFIVPTLVLFVLLDDVWGAGLAFRTILFTAAAIALLGVINTWLLPDPKLRSQAHPSESLPASGRIPTLAAARAMLEPRVAMFCLAMFLVYMSIAAYYTFYPIHLKELGVGDKWLGVISVFGVIIEIGYMHGSQWLRRVLGLRGLMVVGIGFVAIRAALLAAAPVLAVAVGVQVMHGLTVVVIHVVPPVFLNQHAERGYRSSIQGLYIMFAAGLGMLLGNVAAGYIATAGLSTLFYYAAGLCVAAMGLLWWAFSPHAAAGDERREPEVV